MIWDKEETLPREEIEAIQLAKLKDTVRYIYDRVKPYRDKMDAAGIKPDDVQTLEDLKRLPFTYKADFRDHYPDGLFAVDKKDIVRYHASSGTTGKPTVVGYTRNDLDMWLNNVARLACMGGATADDVAQISFGYGTFTGALGLHGGLEKIGASVIPMSSGNTNKQIMFLQDMGVTLLVATPSYALHRVVRGSTGVVTAITADRLGRAQKPFPVEEAAKDGIALHFVNTANMADPAAELRAMTGGTGFDDVFCYAPVAQVAELSSDVLGRDGCLNFFAGPTDPKFAAKLNYYDVHYNSTHVIGTTGGNTADMLESLRLTAEGRIDPAVMVTHIGGLGAPAVTTLSPPKSPGGKKLIYTHITMPLTAIEDFRAKGAQDPRFTALADIVDAHNGLWCPEAEEYLLANWVQE